MDTIYKLTQSDMTTTYGGYKWVVDEWREASGEGELRGPGWLDAHDDPLVALFHSPITGFMEPRLWQGEGAGQRKDDRGLLCGYTRMRVLRELQLPKITLEQFVRYAIGCTWQVGPGAGGLAWRAWTKEWLVDADRTWAAAAAAARGVAMKEEAGAAAWAAAGAAKEAAIAWEAWRDEKTRATERAAWVVVEAVKAAELRAATVAQWAADAAAAKGDLLDFPGLAAWAVGNSTEPPERDQNDAI